MQEIDIARIRWKVKVLRALSHSVNGAYSYSDPGIPEKIFRDQAKRLDFLSEQVAEAIVSGILHAGGAWEPEQEPLLKKDKGGDFFRLSRWAGME